MGALTSHEAACMGLASALPRRGAWEPRKFGFTSSIYNLILLIDSVKFSVISLDRHFVERREGWKTCNIIGRWSFFRAVSLERHF